MSGKGSAPRRFSVSQDEFAQKFDAINWNAREASQSCTLDHPADWPCAICNKDEPDAPQPE
jgi:hypothetical protein